MIAASVIICSHNPRPDYLERVLSALKNQTLAKDQWELLVVDNASNRPLAREYDLSWHPAAEHIRERELGLAFARHRGIRKAKGDFLVFVDDDNLLDGDYLEQALRMGVSDPHLGAWGAGTIRGEFERELAPHLCPYSNYLALRDNKRAYVSNLLTCGESIPVGAGLCVRSAVAAEYLRFCADPANIRITGRRGNSLVGHEDYEICFVGCQMGFGMGVFPELKMIHLIPKERSTDDYFLRLLEGCRISGVVMDFKWPRTYADGFLQTNPQRQLARSPHSIRELLSLCKHALLKRGFERRVYFARRRGTIKGRDIISAEARRVLDGPRG
jgi:glycosyltransferase involved in cell wall biosynthesis